MLNVPGISGCFIMKVMLGYLTCQPRFSEPPSPHPDQGQDAGLPAVAMCPECTDGWAGSIKHGKRLQLLLQGGRPCISWVAETSQEAGEKRRSTAAQRPGRLGPGVHCLLGRFLSHLALAPSSFHTRNDSAPGRCLATTGA